jgi:hypothetical protein
MVAQPAVNDAFALVNAGSIVLVQPLSASARQWLERHVMGETQWWGGALVCEPRYVHALLSGAAKACKAGTITLDNVA